MAVEFLKSQFDQFKTSGQLGESVSESHKAWKLEYDPSLSSSTMLTGDAAQAQINTLFRVRAMVQDVLDLDCYASFYTNSGKLFTCKYGSFPQGEDDQVVDSVLAQRWPVRAVPVPGETGLASAIKLVFYDEIDMKLNKIVDVIAFALDDEWHVVQIIPTEDINVAGARDPLLAYINVLFHGDELASELALYTLMSNIATRTMLAGKISLNVTNCPDEISSIVDGLGRLTRLSYIPLTIDGLNQQQFIPKKDHTQDMLLQGHLQLPNGTVMLIAECTLEAGTLQQTGINNLTALKALVEEQQVSYDYEFSQVVLDCDIPVIILSEGKSLIETNIRLPLAPAQEIPPLPELPSFPCHAYFDMIRNQKAEITEDLRKKCEEYFIEQRKTVEISPEEFSLWLTLAKYVAISHGETVVSVSHWEHVLYLVNLIKQRASG